MKTKRSKANFSASEPDFDDEVNDPTLKVCKKDLNRSDSDTDSFEGRKQAKKEKRSVANTTKLKKV